MFIVVYRPHNLLNMDTQYVGPYATHDEAYDALCELPALGQHQNTEDWCNPGVKFVQEIVGRTTALKNISEAIKMQDEC